MEISREPVPITLLGLPLELQIQILSLLEWDEVLRTRQTCKRLRDASLARPVWLALVKWYSTTIYPRPFCLEKPLDLYIDREPEYLVLRWQKARHYWAMGQYKNITIQRRFVSPDKARNCVHLVGTNSASVLCYDLDASTIEPSILIPTPFDGQTAFDEDEDTEILLSVDYVEAECLKFNLGVMTRRMPHTDPDPSQPRYFRWIQVWRVNLEVEKNGKVKGLRAERLTYFPEQHRNCCGSFRLQDQRIAYILHPKYEFSDLRDGPCIVIVDWTLCNAFSLVYPRKVIWRIIAEWLALLPGNKLLCHFVQNLLLFDLDDAPTTTLDPSQYHLHLTQIAPVAELSVLADAISRPYFRNHATLICLRTLYGVRGVTIPHSNGTSRGTIQRVSLLSRIDLNSQSTCVGYDRALICCWPKLITLQYTWPEDDPSTLVAEKVIDQTTSEGPDDGDCYRDVLFDECSGRIIVHGAEKLLLLDIGNS